TGPSDCAGPTNGCDDYAFEAELQVPLDGLTGSPDVFTFTVSEAVPGRDLNGDGDAAKPDDFVLVLRDRDSGKTWPIGPGGADALGVVRVSQSPFRFPAVASENDDVAFLEAELLRGAAGTDLDGDGDVDDMILHVFRAAGSTAVEKTGSPPIA